MYILTENICTNIEFYNQICVVILIFVTNSINSKQQQISYYNRGRWGSVTHRCKSYNVNYVNNIQVNDNTIRILKERYRDGIRRKE